MKKSWVSRELFIYYSRLKNIISPRKESWKIHQEFYKLIDTFFFNVSNEIIYIYIYIFIYIVHNRLRYLK